MFWERWVDYWRHSSLSRSEVVFVVVVVVLAFYGFLLEVLLEECRLLETLFLITELVATIEKKITKLLLLLLLYSVLWILTGGLESFLSQSCCCGCSVLRVLPFFLLFF